jgi:hypothetical protein
MTLTPGHAENIPLTGRYKRPLPFQVEELR